jgi:hypothetical protein
MRAGPLEIVLIIAVVIAVVVIARIIRTGRAAARSGGNPPTDITAGPTGENRLWVFLNRTGIVLIVAGIAALIAAVSFFRWVLQSYLWAVILIAVGLILMLFSRRKR